MRVFGLALVVGALALPAVPRQVSAGNNTDSSSPSLYSQSAAQAVTQALAQCNQRSASDTFCLQRTNLSYLLLDARSGSILASAWPDAENPIPLGSLVKPFAALAYGAKHEFKYPVHICRGTASGCWLPRGHGKIGIEAAVANSCNSYFRMLTRNMNATDVQPTALMFGLQAPIAEASGANLAGLGGGWLISPLAMARAYVELSHRSNQAGPREILAGMEQSGRTGTGAEVDRALGYASALVKTGTAACTHTKQAPGDGFVISMLPADHPEIVLMVRVHGMPGSHAARIAGELLRRIEE